MPDAVTDEGLFTRNIKLDQTSSELDTYPGCQRFIENILFVSETASYIRLDDSELAPVHSCRLSQNTADDMRYLSRCDHDRSVSLSVCIADKILYVTVLHRLCLIPALYLGKTRFFDRFLDTSHMDLCVGENVVRIILMQLRSSFLHGFLRVKDKRQFFILHALLQDAERL